MTIGILKYKVLKEFCQIQSIIEEENDPIRKGEWIIAKEKTVQLYMKFWKGTKQNDDYLLSENPQLREVKHQLRKNELFHIERRNSSPIDENSFSLFEEMNHFIQKWMIGENDNEEISTEQVTQIFQEWNK